MDRGNAVRESKIVITSVLAMCFLVVAVLAYGLPGGFLLILPGALVIGSRRSIPTER